MSAWRSSFGLPGLLAALVGCSPPTDKSAGPPPLLEALPRSLTASESRLVAAGNQFGFDLLHRVRDETPDANLFLSPISASMALGMTLNGAAGTTLDSMRLALHLDGAPIEEINAGYRGLIDLLRGLDHSSDFRIANSIWGKTGFPFRPEFLTAGRVNFDAEIRAMDFSSPSTVDIINQWVNDKTGGKIPTILDAIDEGEIAFLINAIYFKGSWRVAFDPGDTHPGPFHSGDGTTQSVPTMTLAPRSLRYGATADGEVVELLYGNGAFVMTLVLPHRDRSLDQLLAGLDASRWAEWLGGVHGAEIGLTLPKFRLDYQRELKDDLSALGMRVAFDPTGRADFSRMADLSPGVVYITRVTQKTFVNVNEEGTEAAAAPSVGMGVTSAPLTVTVDRPFFFAIRERLSGTILFLGQINRIP